ncbi:MAG TPA: hypothetical protein VF618_00985 [Thermoanaerobaculia bacterium]
MKAWVVAAIATLVSHAAAASWINFDVSLSATNAKLESFSYAQNSSSLGILGGFHEVNNEHSWYWRQGINKYGSTYSGVIRFDPATGCYLGKLVVTFSPLVGSSESHSAQSNSGWRVCVNDPPPPPATCKEPAPDGTCPPTGSACLPETPPEECQLSPIVINVDRGGYRLSGPDDPVQFDLDADGALDTITWTARGEGMAFLALDLNGNNWIDDGSELFGNYTRISGDTAANGFVALAQYDRNGDRRIDERDPIWSALVLWADVNHDGVSQREEMGAVAATEITALDLDYVTSGRSDPAGNTYRFQARLQRGPAAHPYYDIFFLRIGNGSGSPGRPEPKC